MKKTRKAVKTVTVIVCIGSMALFGFRQHLLADPIVCWDTVYHPGIPARGCECDKEDMDPCISPVAIQKAGWVACPQPGDIGGWFEGECNTKSTEVGQKWDCAGSINKLGAQECLEALIELGSSGSAFGLPGTLGQVVGFVGLVTSMYDVVEDCEYCDLVQCTPSSPTTTIWRDVFQEDAETCGGG